VLGEGPGCSGGVGAHQDLPLALGVGATTCAAGWASTAMWSAAVLEPALRVRSSLISGSPVPDWQSGARH
jgi:hypothetical protein